MEQNKPTVKYKAYLILGRKMYQVKWVFNEIPEYQEIGTKRLKLGLVLWNCNNKSKLDQHKFMEVQALIYR